MSFDLVTRRSKDSHFQEKLLVEIKVYILSVVLFLIVTLLTGCGSPEATTFGERTPTATTASPAVTETTPTSSVSVLVENDQYAAVESLIKRLGDNAWDELVYLTRNHSPRASATAQEKQSANYLAYRFGSIGYESHLQPFMVERLLPEVPVLTLTSIHSKDGSPRRLEAFPMANSGEGVAEGIVVDVGKALKSDIGGDSLVGRIALIERGDISFQEKVDRVAQAKALAAVVYNNVPGGFGGKLFSEADIPSVSISRRDGLLLKGLLSTNEVTAQISVVYDKYETWNVIAQDGRKGDGKSVVVLGGHYDTVPNVKGANDNGSGVATILTLADELEGRVYPFALRFVLFGSEEIGLLGSKYYVQSLPEAERNRIIMMLNFDALGTGPVTGVLGDSELVEEIVDYGRVNRIDVEKRLTIGLSGGSSDHASFEAAGIPVVFFLADDVSRIHTAADELQFVERDLMGSAAALTIGLLEEISR